MNRYEARPPTLGLKDKNKDPFFASVEDWGEKEKIFEPLGNIVIIFDEIYDTEETKNVIQDTLANINQNLVKK